MDPRTGPIAATITVDTDAAYPVCQIIDFRYSGRFCQIVKIDRYDRRDQHYKCRVPHIIHNPVFFQFCQFLILHVCPLFHCLRLFVPVYPHFLFSYSNVRLKRCSRSCPYFRLSSNFPSAVLQHLLLSGTVCKVRNCSLCSLNYPVSGASDLCRIQIPAQL